MTEEKFITLGDNKIRYLEAGKSENNLVLLHGLGASANRWDPVISYLSKKFHLIIPDLIGYGYSDKPLDNYTIKFFVNFLTDFLEEIDIKKTSIVASSLGGQIAAECAIRQNSSFEKLVLVSPSGINPRLSPVMDEYMLAMIRPDKQRTLHAFKQMVGPNKEVDSKIIDDFIQRISMPNAKMAIMSTLLGLKNAENKTGPKLSSNSALVETLNTSSMYIFCLSASSSSGIIPFLKSPETRQPISFIIPANLISSSCNKRLHFC